jgi:TfoX-like protein
VSISALFVRYRDMAYDEDLANRIREQLAGETAISEKAMFGGLAFLLNGHMCVSASGRGGLLARVDPDESAEALSEPHASPMEMRGRQMPGWIFVEPEGVDSDEQLAGWVERSRAFVRTLPAKG